MFQWYIYIQVDMLIANVPLAYDKSFPACYLLEHPFHLLFNITIAQYFAAILGVQTLHGNDTPKYHAVMSKAIDCYWAVSRITSSVCGVILVSHELRFQQIPRLTLRVFDQ